MIWSLKNDERITRIQWGGKDLSVITIYSNLGFLGKISGRAAEAFETIIKAAFQEASTTKQEEIEANAQVHNDAEESGRTGTEGRSQEGRNDEEPSDSKDEGRNAAGGTIPQEG